MSDRLDKIKRKMQFSSLHKHSSFISEDDQEWLISEVERLERLLYMQNNPSLEYHVCGHCGRPCRCDDENWKQQPGDCRCDPEVNRLQDEIKRLDGLPKEIKECGFWVFRDQRVVIDINKLEMALDIAKKNEDEVRYECRIPYKIAIKVFGPEGHRCAAQIAKRRKDAAHS